MIISSFLALAQGMKVSRETLRAMLEPLRPKSLGRPVTFEEMREHNYISIRPEELPAEIANILKYTGLWKNICRTVRRINLAHSLNLRLGTQTPFGHESIPGEVSLDVYDEDKEQILPPVFGALFLAHEAAGHVVWRSLHYNDSLLMRTLINERYAYIQQYLAGKGLLKGFMAQRRAVGQDVLFAIATNLSESYLAVTNANRILGYRSDDLSIRTDIPSLENTELNIHPAFIPSTSIKDVEKLRTMLKRLGLSKKIVDAIHYNRFGSENWIKQQFRTANE